MLWRKEGIIASAYKIAWSRTKDSFAWIHLIENIKLNKGEDIQIGNKRLKEDDSRLDVEQLTARAIILETNEGASRSINLHQWEILWKYRNAPNQNDFSTW